ncbi:unnamed protein product [Urochloa decumbens]|uniref:Protein kinase domain-containing protein n=1 Tax=Urochloa decumbens TaxID=240449 RepID=A0ABC9BJW1_9POAL
MVSDTSLPAVLNWGINHTTCHGNGSSAACRSSHSFCDNYGGGTEAHVCNCAQGNPYIPNGCEDVNECDDPETYPCHGNCNNTEGARVAVPVLCWLPGQRFCTKWMQRMEPLVIPSKKGVATPSQLGLPQDRSGRTLLRRGQLRNRSHCWSYRTLNERERNRTQILKIGLGVGVAKQNHGLLQQLVSQNSDIGGRMVFTLRGLEKATNKFDPSHEISGGGHGVVYKELLDLQVVAIKKSKIIVQREIDDFINEVAILSQINHRNIVKLIGCCLETEVPLLVYEFVSNGILAHHVHVEGTVSLPWDDRLRIALEISKALAYLHSAASTPILHRDIKSSNILIDDNLTAKVSDFRASKYIPIDKTGVTTAIQGTIGYLDPMYYYTSRLTDKSDVFSFGVLLIELLTRKKPFVYRSDDGEGLVTHFASLLAQGTLIDIIDPQILEGEDEAANEVTTLAAKCTKLNGENRPTMREVEMALENLRGTKKQVHHNTTSRRKYEKDHYMSFGGLPLEISRQYTMEEEILLSARYPR